MPLAQSPKKVLRSRQDISPVGAVNHPPDSPAQGNIYGRSLRSQQFRGMHNDNQLYGCGSVKQVDASG